MKINWGFNLNPPLEVLPKADLETYGYARLKHRVNGLGWRGFVVLTGSQETILAVYRRW